MTSFFHQNDYPESITTSALNKVNNLSQDDALLPVDRKQTNNRIPFTLTYHPLNNRIKKIIYNNYHILSNDAHTKEISHAPPLMAFSEGTKTSEIASFASTFDLQIPLAPSLAIITSAKLVITSTQQPQSPMEADPLQLNPSLPVHLQASSTVAPATNIKSYILAKLPDILTTDLANT